MCVRARARACVCSCLHACICASVCLYVLIRLCACDCLLCVGGSACLHVRVRVVCRCVCTHTTLYSHSNRRVLCCRVASRLERYLDSLRAWTLERRTFFSQQQLTEFQTEHVRADLTLTFCEAASRLDSRWVTATVRGHVSAAIRRAALTGVCRGWGWGAWLD